MTKQQIEERIETLLKRRDDIIDRLTDSHAVASASLSAGASSRSYTNLSPQQLEQMLKRTDKEIARLEASIGLRSAPNKIKSIRPRYK